MGGGGRSVGAGRWWCVDGGAATVDLLDVTCECVWKGEKRKRKEGRAKEEDKRERRGERKGGRDGRCER